MKIIPLAWSQTNWPDFLQLATETVGRAPTRSLDKANIRPGDPFSYIAALEELDNEGTSPRNAILVSNHLLRHISVSFMAQVSDRELNYLVNIPILQVSQIEGRLPNRGEPDHLLLLSGNLLDWQCCIPIMLSAEHTYAKDTVGRELFNSIYNWFKKMNLRELFDKYTERPTSDGFFRLEGKC